MLETLSRPGRLAKFVTLATSGKLGNVYSPGGGFEHSPLGGGLDNDIVDAAAELAGHSLQTISVAEPNLYGAGIVDVSAGGDGAAATGSVGVGDVGSDGGAGAGSSDGGSDAGDAGDST